MSIFVISAYYFYMKFWVVQEMNYQVKCGEVLSVIPALWKLRQEDREFEINIFYMVRACLKMRERENPKHRSTQLHHHLCLLPSNLNKVLSWCGRGKSHKASPQVKSYRQGATLQRESAQGWASWQVIQEVSPKHTHGRATLNGLMYICVHIYGEGVEKILNAVLMYQNLKILK